MIGPSLPKNINKQITILLPKDNVVVKLSLKPTVPKAENVSYNTASVVAAAFPLSNEAIQMYPTNKTTTDKNTKVIVLIIDELVNSLLNAEIFLPCKNLIKQRIKTKIVVVLIPPAVLIGDPPMNIKTQLTVFPAGDNAD